MGKKIAQSTVFTEENIKQIVKTLKEREILFKIKVDGYYDALGKIDLSKTSNRVIVFKGSKLQPRRDRDPNAKTMKYKDKIRVNREKHKKNGFINDQEFLNDCEFDSIASAARFIYYREPTGANGIEYFIEGSWIIGKDAEEKGYNVGEIKSLEDGNVKNFSDGKTGIVVGDSDADVCFLNQILYGPPGTGKTYHTIDKAVTIIDAKFQGDHKKAKEAFEDYKSKGQIEFVTFHQSYGYEEFIRGIKPSIKNGQVVYSVEDGIFKSFCDRARVDKEENGKDAKKYVFIIDEINRGNVSKIFGELITLIENGKRIGAEEELRVKLPYAKSENEPPFGVPDNVYILGTMNTADRSLVQLDAALRRRFRFEEMPPRPDLLEEKPDGVDLSKLLNAINKKMCELVDREHQIGHSYFMGVEDIMQLKDIFKYEIIPLLQEYFYEDYENIRAVLGGQDFMKDQKICVDVWGKENFEKIYN